jgi:hypothetical protein
MERRGVFCNKLINETEINEAIVYADWDAVGRRDGEVYDEGGQPLPSTRRQFLW